MSVATVVTEGFGSFGTVNFLPTEGFGPYGVTPPPAPPPATSGPGGKKRWRYIDTEEARLRRFLAHLAQETPEIAVPDRKRRFAAIVRAGRPGEAAFRKAEADAAVRREAMLATLTQRDRDLGRYLAQRATERQIAQRLAKAAADEQDDEDIFLLM